jgi:hypothetical protein
MKKKDINQVIPDRLGSSKVSHYFWLQTAIQMMIQSQIQAKPNTKNWKLQVVIQL